MRVRLILMFIATSSCTLRLGFLYHMATDVTALNKQQMDVVTAVLGA